MAREDSRAGYGRGEIFASRLCQNFRGERGDQLRDRAKMTHLRCGGRELACSIFSKPRGYAVSSIFQSVARPKLLLKQHVSERNFHMRLMRWQRPELSNWGALDQLSNLRQEINRLFELPFGESTRESE